jgi:hypothetical protein
MTKNPPVSPFIKGGRIKTIEKPDVFQRFRLIRVVINNMYIK